MADEKRNSARASASGMAARIKRLLTRPREEWARIDAEPMTVREVMTRWAAPLSAIGPVATLVATEAWGFQVLGMVYRPPLASAIGSALVGYLTALIGVYAVALVIDNVAPSFGAKRSMVAATKVAVFSSTAAWLAQAFWLIPPLSVLSLAGFYSLYLFWVGLPALMKPPADKAQTYAAVSIAFGVIAFFLATLIVGIVSDALTPSPTSVGTFTIG